MTPAEYIIKLADIAHIKTQIAKRISADRVEEVYNYIVNKLDESAWKKIPEVIEHRHGGHTGKNSMIYKIKHSTGEYLVAADKYSKKLHTVLDNPDDPIGFHPFAGLDKRIPS